MLFNADEVFEMAEQIERNGADFYRRAAGNLPAHARVLNIIADQEDQHQLAFAKMRETFPSAAGKNMALDPDVTAYLQALAGVKVLDTRLRPEDIFRKDAAFADILNFAVGMEKDSIVFYLGIQRLVPPALGGKALDLIVREEMQHIVFLNQLSEAQQQASAE